jgi:hypothetical protein
LIPLIIRLFALSVKVLGAPFKLMNPRIGCLVLVLLAVVLFVSCGMLGRLTVTF